MPNMDSLYNNIHFALRLELINTTNDYSSLHISVKKKHNWFSKNTYRLTCIASENNIIQLILSNKISERIIGINNEELNDLLIANNYDTRHNQFKNVSDAQVIADYINSAIVLRTLKI